MRYFLDNNLLSHHKEHLTLYFYDNKERFHVQNISPPDIWNSPQSFTVDVQEDYDFVHKIAERFKNPFFSISELIDRT